jgi:hypothetical protein
VSASGPIAGSLSAGAYSFGSLAYTDTNIFASYNANVNSYAQIILANGSGGAAASTDFIVGNNNTTMTTYFGDFGMNSSGFTGSGAFNAPNNVFLTSTSVDLAIGTTTNNAIHFVVNSGTTDAMTISAAGNVTAGGNVAVGNNLTVTGTSTLTGNVTTAGSITATGTLVMGSSFKRNRIINGNMATDQRNAGAAQTITAGAALAYSVDRWYAYCTGANVTGQQVAGATANQYRYGFTGAASVTAINFAQRIEAINSADLAGTTATLSVDLANSLLTTVTWTAYYANTTDTFGTLASPTVTSIATGTFTITSTVTRYNAQISIPSAATTGLQIVLSVGAQTSGTWTIGNVQLEVGTKATPYEMQIYNDQLAQCQRYYEVCSGIYMSSYNVASAAIGSIYCFKVTKRTAPTLTVTTTPDYTTNSSGFTARIPTVNSFQYYCRCTGAANTVFGDNTQGVVTASAEL